MKFLSIVLMACIFLLSSFAGMVKANAPVTKPDCCKHMARKACHNKPGKDDDCSKPSCAMLFSCSICGFLTVEPLRMQAIATTTFSKSVPHYTMGALSAWHATDFKPPKNV